jgi:hypothetical protein
MIDATKAPARKPRRRRTGEAAPSGLSATLQAASAADDAVVDKPVLPIARPVTSWPFKARDTAPLAWWRTLPPDVFRDAERLLLLATLDGICVLNGGAGFAAAISGDATAAIGVGFSKMPITERTLTADIAMTALLRCALERNATAALVLAQIIGLTELEHTFGAALAASWYTYALHHSADPRKLGQAGAVLLAAFREGYLHGDDQ